MEKSNRSEMTFETDQFKIIWYSRDTPVTVCEDGSTSSYVDSDARAYIRQDRVSPWVLFKTLHSFSFKYAVGDVCPVITMETIPL